MEILPVLGQTHLNKIGITGICDPLKLRRRNQLTQSRAAVMWSQLYGRFVPQHPFPKQFIILRRKPRREYSVNHKAAAGEDRRRGDEEAQEQPVLQ